MREKMTCFDLCASPVLTQNENIWNFNGSLTLNRFRFPWYAIMSNVTRFVILFGMREKLPVLNCVSPVLAQNKHIWNFHGSLTLNNGELLEATAMPLCQI